MFVNSDFSDLLRLFQRQRHPVSCYWRLRVVQYAEPRYTKDLDLWIGTDEQNARAVYQALRAFGAPLSDLTERDFMEEETISQMGVPPLRVDVFVGIPGVEFEFAWQ